jgi:hypothetical protein
VRPGPRLRTGRRQRSLPEKKDFPGAIALLEPMAKAEPKKADVQPELERALTGQPGKVGLLGKARFANRSLLGTLNGGGASVHVSVRVRASGGYVSLFSFQLFFDLAEGSCARGKD